MDRLMVTVSGIRGVVGSTLTPRVARDFGYAFGTMLGAGSNVVIGRDSRPSGPDLQHAITAGLLATGVNVTSLGVASTPAVALMTAKLAADGGVIVTASHNPRQYNGIKFLQPSGTGLTAGDAMKLKGIWESGQFATAAEDARGSQSHDDTAPRRHLDDVLAICDVETIASKRFKVVLDSINGAGCVATPAMMEKLGCELVHLNAEATGDFAHNPEPIEENLTELCQAVRGHGAAVGFAQDADADRLAIVDENGRFIGEEYTLALAAAFVLSKRKGDIATNLSTSRMVDDLAARAGCKVVRTPTGEANVVSGMLAGNCILAGEGGGGVIEPLVVPVRDSFVAIAYVLQYLAETGISLSELVARIPAYVMLKTKQPCPEGAIDRIIDATRQAFSYQLEARLNDSDGLRIDFDDAWVSVRASNTEPIMRIMAEAPSIEDAEALVAEVTRIAGTVTGPEK
ncbi:MAG: phosphoglucosamine mutase [Phycisphaerae bacterium]|nr:phosphoglucosamine mutase [Planctomycetota bacterium]MBL7220570.1 phosphoglucosamine mutase [Phycisphaerae bacterium]